MTKVTGSSSELNIAVVSDIHLGHARNPTSRIIKNLMDAFPDNTETALIDMIVLAGDVFDGLLNLPDDEVTEIDVWISYMLRLCAKHKILLRVLEGTPSHDWKQSVRFQTLNNVAGIGADLIYVKDLSVRYEPTLDIWCGFIPDEWSTSTDNTLSQMYDLLRSKGLAQVDYMFMHGQFAYQLPAIVKAQKHDEQAYLKITKHLIFIGHVHVHSRFERILAQGSFDRLSQGEEGPKGHIRVYKRGDEHDVVFVENKNALKFITIKCYHLELTAIFELISKTVKDLEEGSFVRIEANYDNPIFSNMDELIKAYPFYTWDKKPVNDEESQNQATQVDEEIDYVPITITRDNVTTMLTDRLINAGASSDQLVLARAIMIEVI